MEAHTRARVCRLPAGRLGCVVRVPLPERVVPLAARQEGGRVVFEAGYFRKTVLEEVFREANRLPYGGHIILLTDAADELFAAAVRLKEKACLPGFSTEEIFRIANAAEEALRRCREAAEQALESEYAEEWEDD